MARDDFPVAPTKIEQFMGTVRPPTAADFPAIRSILEMWVLHDEIGVVDEDRIGNMLGVIQQSIEGKNGAEYRVAEEGGKVVGIMGLTSGVEEKLQGMALTDNPGQLINVYVDPDYAVRRGVGSRLLSEMEGLARTKNLKELLLLSSSGRKDTAWEFYNKKFGLAVGQVEWQGGRSARVWRKIL